MSIEIDEQLPTCVADEVMDTGRTYFKVESTYWGNEGFGVWDTEFTGKLAVETEKGIKFDRVRTLSGREVGQGWLPKSKVEKQVTGPEPENHVIVSPDGTKHKGKASEADYQISETDSYQGRYRAYPKFVIDFDYNETLKENLKREGDEQWWTDYHVAAKFENDNFVHWWLDGDIDVIEFARKLSDEKYSVAIHTDFLEQ